MHRSFYVRAHGDFGAPTGGDEGVGDRSTHARRLLADLVADDALLLVPPMVADEIEKRACVACGVTGSTPKGGGATNCCLVNAASPNTPCRFIPTHSMMVEVRRSSISCGRQKCKFGAKKVISSSSHFLRTMISMSRKQGWREGRKASGSMSSAERSAVERTAAQVHRSALAFSPARGVGLCSEPTPNKVHLPLACGLRSAAETAQADTPDRAPPAGLKLW